MSCVAFHDVWLRPWAPESLLPYYCAGRLVLSGSSAHRGRVNGGQGCIYESTDAATMGIDGVYRAVARGLGWSAAANRWRIPLSVCAAERERCKSGVSLSFFVTAAEDTLRAVDAAGVRR